MNESSKTPDAGDGPLRTFVGLFFVPLLVVVLCVGVFVGFGWIAYEHQSTSDYLNDLRSSWRPRRAQAAYELSKILVADPSALDDDPAARVELRTLFEQADAGEMKRYLALILGYTRDPEATSLLIEAVDDEDSQTSIYALMALGTTGDPAAEPALVAALQSTDPGVRKTAAYALGELGLPSAVVPLETLIDDSVADVRWNAALSLSRLGSDTGKPILLEMMNRNLVQQVPGITPSQAEDAMVSAIVAIGLSRSEAARPQLEALSTEDPSLKVRQAAIEALKALG